MKSGFARRPFWLIVGQRTRGLEVFTNGGGEILPVFSYEEEAEMFLRHEVSEKGWRVRECTCGELASILCALRMDVRHVALDPLPEMVAGSSVGLVRLSRKAFVEALLTSPPIPPLGEEPYVTEVAS